MTQEEFKLLKENNEILKYILQYIIELNSYRGTEDIKDLVTNLIANLYANNRLSNKL